VRDPGHAGERREPAADGQVAWYLYLLIPIALALYLIFPRAKEPAAPAGEPSYRSDYVVFGGVDRAGDWIVVPIDLNRADDGAGEIGYEYKGWVGRPRSFDMFLFEKWKAKGAAGAMPPRAGLRAAMRDDGGYSIHFDGKGLELRLNTAGTRESFRELRPGRGPVTTTLAPGWLVVNGDSVSGVAVEEEIRFSGADTTAGPRFGRFEWISLWSTEGDAWLLVDSGRTGSFAYHRAPDGDLADAKHADVHWTRTGLDTVSGREVPDRWKVEVPDWDFAASLEKSSGHTGHGPEEAGAPRPVYAQIGVTGTVSTGGRRRAVYGMVEHIQDGPVTGGRP
jgi:hypothetical protein